MPGDFNFRVRGLEELKASLEGMAIDLRRVGVVAASKYVVQMLRDNSDPPYTYHSRAEAYPQSLTIDYGPHKGKVVQGYFSSKQYYFVTIGVREGTIKIPHVRSSQIKDGWVAVWTGLNSQIKNTADEKALRYTMSAKQSAHESLIPWPRVDRLLVEHSDDIVQAANIGIFDYLTSGEV